jgi:hypothetical protein
MADIKTHHAAPIPTGPVAEDGLSYRGIVWFVVILVATTAFCQLLVWGMFELSSARASGAEAPRPPLAGPAPGHMEPPALPPGPNLLTNEPMNLRTFRVTEDAALSTYGWIDQNAGIVRIPIDRAKELALERGLFTAAPAPGSAAPTSGAGQTEAKGKQGGS